MSKKERYINAVGMSPGIGVGTAYLFRQEEQTVQRRTVRDADSEIVRFYEAVQQASRDIEALYEQTKQRIGADEAAIFEAHRMMLDDPEFSSAIEGRILEESVSAEYAVQSTADQYIALFERIEDDYLKARAADVRDIAARLLRTLSGRGERISEALPERAILLAEELAPSDTVTLDRERVAGIVTERGGPTSHAAILAKSLGIPAVTGASELFANARYGDEIIVDGSAGAVILHPAPGTVATYEDRRERQHRTQRELLSLKGQPSVSLDGCSVLLCANIGSLTDLDAVLENDADGVGLFRTEFLFMERDRPPTEAEQFEVYRAAAEALDGKPLIIRTLDAGGDKALPYLDLPPEDNPFLGRRAIRLCLDHPDLFIPQLRAILRAGLAGDVRLMLPLVNVVGEVHRAKEFIEQAKSDLRREGIDFKEDLPVGIMIETPAAVLHADALAKNVDFFSIGTNDLIQYTLACDRGNADTAELYTPYHPAVLSLIRTTIASAHRAGIHVGLCGEAASDERLIPALLAMGLDSFSMNTSSILKARYIVRNSTCHRSDDLIDRMLAQPTASAIQTFLNRHVPSNRDATTSTP